jgi:hypothetical protein
MFLKDVVSELKINKKINTFYNHTHFSHIVVCVTHFLVTIVKNTI